MHVRADNSKTVNKNYQALSSTAWFAGSKTISCLLTRTRKYGKPMNTVYGIEHYLIPKLGASLTAKISVRF